MPRNTQSRYIHFAKHGGFTLIELMVVVVILGIIAAIAYPSYRDYVAKARRTDAKTSLTEAAGRQEKFYANNLRFAASLDDLGYNSPFESNDGHYRLSLSTAASDQEYTLTASPTPGGLQVGDGCGNLTLNNAGVRNRTGSLPLDKCW